MKHWITTSGYLFILALALIQSRAANTGFLIQRLLSYRSTRMAILIIWWWIGLHFLNAPN